MITMREFVGGFPGFWAECLPYLSNAMMAEWNRIGATGGVRSYRRAIPRKDLHANDAVAELAFLVLGTALTCGYRTQEVIRDDILMSELRQEAVERVIGFRRPGTLSAGSLLWYTKEAGELAASLEAYFEGESSLRPIILEPRFQGCGALDSCNGDLIAASAIVEVKSVLRTLRSSDIRQVLTYAALNFESNQYAIDEVRIVNPRKGVEYRCDMEDLAQRCARSTSHVVLGAISGFLVDLVDTHQVS